MSTRTRKQDESQGVQSDSFAQRLRAHRLHAGLTQEQLAELSGLSLDAVSALERGSRLHPHPNTVLHLAAALQLTDDDRWEWEALAKPARAAEPGRSRPDFETPLMGREAELRTLAKLLQTSGIRLVTLTGPGGVGKTRLALAVADEVRQTFPDGIFFVDLASIARGELLVPGLGRAVGLRHLSPGDPIGSLEVRLRGRRVLLLVDNFEHLIEQALHIGELVRRCRDVKLLITSRESLRVISERAVAVRPLAVPPTHGSNINESPAVQLFAQRAQSANPAFRITGENQDAVAALCVRLDGLPLAIELAAAQCSFLTPTELLRHVEHPLHALGSGPRDAPVRHRTLRDAIGWSYSLLSEAERTLFRRLAVFSGDWDLAAAEGVCAEAQEPVASPIASGETPSFTPGVDVVGLLGCLVDKSLVQVRDELGASRFSMLRTIREYAYEELQRHHEAERLHRNHALHYLDILGQERSDAAGPPSEKWLQLRYLEEPNLTQAMEWALRADSEIALRLGTETWLFWLGTGRLNEGRLWLRLLLNQTASDARPRIQTLRAGILRAAGVLAWLQGDYESASANGEEAAATYERLGNRHGVIDCLGIPALVALDQGDFDRAQLLQEERLALAEELDDRYRKGRALLELGVVAIARRRLHEARQHLHRALHIMQESRREFEVAEALAYLGDLAVAEHDLDTAVLHYGQSLELSQQLSHKVVICRSFAGLGKVCVERGLLTSAVRLLAAAAALRRDIGVRASPLDQSSTWTILEGLRSSLGATEFARCWELGQREPLTEGISLAKTVT